MSYILDALKKSDKERRRVKSPDLLLVQDAMPHQIKKRPFFQYVIAGALLLNALFLLFWLRPDPSKGRSVAPVRMERGVGAVSAGHAESEKASAPDNKADKKRPVEEKFNLVPPVVQQQNMAKAQVAPEPKPAVEVEQLAANRIYNRNELPPSIQQSLPDFNITVSIYSENPAARMIKLNGQILHEGESLSAGLKLEEIEPNGAILSYHNYRFRVGLR